MKATIASKKIIDNQNISNKITKLIDRLNSLNYKLEGDDEVLVDIAKSEKYKYTTKENFNKIYRVISKYVKAKLRMCYDMNKIQIPFESKCISALATNDFSTNNKLILIIPDRGLDSFGVYSKVSLVYESLKKGSFINFVELGLNMHYSILITNPNKKREGIACDYHSQIEHVWKELITGSKMSNIILVGDKNASLSIIKLMNKFEEDFKNRVKKIALINSSHNCMYEILSNQMKIEFENKCTNYILSNASVGSLLYSHSESLEGCENRSCGTRAEDKAHYLLSGEIKKYL